MSEENLINNPSPARLREELNKYMDHVRTHNPDSAQFVIGMTGHTNEDGTGIHVCQIMGGAPVQLAEGVTQLMEMVVDQFPLAALAFLAKAMELSPKAREKLKLELGKSTVDELLAKLNIPSNGKLH